MAIFYTKCHLDSRVIRKEIEERRRELEWQHAAERGSILKEAEDAKKEFVDFRTQEELRLRQKVDELAQREKALDDRHHMHARRELRQQITDNIKRRIQQPLVSKRTSVLRWTVFGLTLTVGLIMGYYGVLGIGTEIFDIQEVFGKETFSEFSYIGFSIQRGVLLFLSVGFIAYSINWLRLVYLDDVRMERRYESYSNDIDRASFVIETIMEVGEKKDMEAPEAWIEGVCRNLFLKKETTATEKSHPMRRQCYLNRLRERGSVRMVRRLRWVARMLDGLQRKWEKKSEHWIGTRIWSTRYASLVCRELATQYM